MNAGINYVGYSVSKDYSETITQDIERTFVYDVSIDYNITCTAQPENPGVGLWQWVIGTNDT